MPQMIDVSGLTPRAVEQVEALVAILRDQSAPVVQNPRDPNETSEQWVARLRAWAASRPKRDIVIDDSRESIY